MYDTTIILYKTTFLRTKLRKILKKIIMYCTIELKRCSIMNDKLTLDITNIQIIVQKFEKGSFHFHNPKRSFDGFVMVNSGNGYTIAPDGKRYSISKGDIILLNENDRYSTVFDDSCSYIASGLTINTDKNLLPYIHRCTEKQYNSIMNINKVWQSRAWDSYSECRIELMKFYLEVIKSNMQKSTTENDFIAKAVTFIHSNFKTKFSGRELSEYCSVSLSYLRASFLKKTGMSIVEYRDSLRIDAAKEMLRSERFTVSEIALELGYCDVYHFSKAFSKFVGCSPTKWKQQNTKILQSL